MPVSFDALSPPFSRNFIMPPQEVSSGWYPRSGDYPQKTLFSSFFNPPRPAPAGQTSLPSTGPRGYGIHGIPRIPEHPLLKRERLLPISRSSRNKDAEQQA